MNKPSILDVLDDLATAVCVHDSYGAAALDTVLMIPILERALAIVEKATGGASDAILPWGFPENRPALRAMDRLIGGRLASGDDSGGEWLAGRMLALNPNDNHGTRALIVCADLRLYPSSSFFRGRLLSASRGSVLWRNSE